MAENEAGQEKTEQATGKRISQARQKGQVARSRDFSSMMVLLGGASIFLFAGGRVISGMQEIMVRGLAIERNLIFEEPIKLLDFFLGMLADALLALWPFLLTVVLAALVSPLTVGGWNFAPKALGLKLNKLNPISGLKRIFSLKGLIELPKTLGKFVVVATVAVLMLWFFADDIFMLGRGTIETDLARAGELIVWGFVIMACALMLIAVIDVPFQIWNHAKEMRMAKQEVKDERKNTEGNPEIKNRVRRIQAEMSRKRMMSEVPQADVVVTNPTHFAVALSYQQGRMGAPKVVAKGADLVAAHIREVAMENGVPIFSAPPLARALWFSARLNQEIPAGLYIAVAQILAYIYQLKAAVELGGVAPPPPTDLPVPEELLPPREVVDPA